MGLMDLILLLVRGRHLRVLGAGHQRLFSRRLPRLIALGCIGALVGLALSRALGLPEILALNFDSTSFPIVWSIIGAALFVAVIGLLARRRYRTWD